MHRILAPRRDQDDFQVMPCGKHRGMTFLEVLINFESYARWAVDQNVTGKLQSFRLYVLRVRALELEINSNIEFEYDSLLSPGTAYLRPHWIRTSWSTIFLVWLLCFVKTVVTAGAINNSSQDVDAGTTQNSHVQEPCNKACKCRLDTRTQSSRTIFFILCPPPNKDIYFKHVFHSTFAFFTPIPNVSSVGMLKIWKPIYNYLKKVARLISNHTLPHFTSWLQVQKHVFHSTFALFTPSPNVSSVGMLKIWKPIYNSL